MNKHLEVSAWTYWTFFVVRDVQGPPLERLDEVLNRDAPPMNAVFSKCEPSQAFQQGTAGPRPKLISCLVSRISIARAVDRASIDGVAIGLRLVHNDRAATQDVRILVLGGDRLRLASVDEHKLFAGVGVIEGLVNIPKIERAVEAPFVSAKSSSNTRVIWCPSRIPWPLT